MYKTTRLALLALAFSLIPASALPLAITSGTATFSIDDTTGFDTSPSANFTFGTGDALFEYGWWVRGPGETSETALGLPSVVINGNQMTFTYNSLPGTLNSVVGSMLYTLVQSGSYATLTSSFTLTNNGDSPITFSLFQFIDEDVNGSASGDSASGDVSSGITITDGTSGRAMRMFGSGAAFYMARAFSAATDVAALLSDASLTDFDNSGLPFTNGDFTGGFQWNITLNSGASTVINTELVNSLDATLPPLSSSTVPEPSTFGMIGVSLLSLVALRRRKA